MRWIVIVVVIIAAVFALSVALSPKDDAPALGNGRSPGSEVTPTPVPPLRLSATGAGMRVIGASSSMVRVEIKALVRNLDERAARIERMRYDVYYWDETSYWVYLGSTDVPVNSQVQGGGDAAVTVMVNTHTASVAEQVHARLLQGPLRMRAGGAVRGSVAGQTGQAAVSYETDVTLPE